MILTTVFVLQIFEVLPNPFYRPDIPISDCVFRLSTNLNDSLRGTHY